MLYQATRRITKGMVRRFLVGTRDPNEKLHEDYAMGIQLERILQRPADNHIGQFYSGLRCERIEATFPRTVNVNSEVGISEPRQAEVPGYQQSVSLEVHVDGETAVRGTFSYNHPPQSQQSMPSLGHVFVLRRKRARQTASGLEEEVNYSVITPDYQSLAIGLVSNALFQDGRQLIIQKKSEGKVPIYLAHTFEVTQELDRLEDGDQIKIKTDAAEVDSKRDKFKADVFATKYTGKEEGPLLYTGTLIVKFINPEELKKRQEPKQQ